MTNRIHNPHLQILTFSLLLLFYNYYAFALSLNLFVVKHHLNHESAIYYAAFFSPFAFSSLARPVGGVIASMWQIKSKNCIFPTMLIIYSILGLIVNILSKFVYVEKIVVLTLLIRIIQGLLIGGIIPQYLMYFYARSLNLNQKVFYSTCLFIAYSISVVCSSFIMHFFADDLSYWFNIGISVGFIIIAYIIFEFKQIGRNLLLDGTPVTESLPFWATLKSNYGSIIRFALFLSFMASVASFFLTIMPFYLTRYLHYNSSDVFFLVIVTAIAGIIGFVVGGYYHTTVGRKWHLILGIIIKIALYFLFRVYMLHNLLLIQFFSALCLFSAGIMLAKISLILNSIFSPKARLFGISITYNISMGLMFGFFGLVIMQLLNYFHNLYTPSLLIIFFSYLSLISLWFTPEKDFFRYLETT